MPAAACMGRTLHAALVLFIRNHHHDEHVLFSDTVQYATLPSKDLGTQVTIPQHADDPKTTFNDYLGVEDEPDTLTAYVGGWIRLNRVGPVFARITSIGVEVVLLVANLNTSPGDLALGMCQKRIDSSSFHWIVPSATSFPRALASFPDLPLRIFRHPVCTHVASLRPILVYACYLPLSRLSCDSRRTVSVIRWYWNRPG
eukprot:COSAG02_NODE_981_length_15488_cov_27.585093_5_plen_200_part_00